MSVFSGRADEADKREASKVEADLARPVVVILLREGCDRAGVRGSRASRRNRSRLAQAAPLR